MTCYLMYIIIILVYYNYADLTIIELVVVLACTEPAMTFVTQRRLVTRHH